MHTPWGPAQTISTIAEGIVSVTTASHGGILLDERRTTAMPPYMTAATWTHNGSAYEEDCDWCMPALVFEAEFRAFYIRERRSDIEAIFNAAKSTLRHCHPDVFETFYGVALKPGESRARDKRQFLIDNKDNWIVTAAWGDWQAGVPKSMVGVCAHRGNDQIKRIGKERFFLVPAEEYRTTQRVNGFVIDLARHQEIAPLT